MGIRIAVIGLGYVGLPLARLLATKYSVVGFDTDKSRVNELQLGNDRTLEISKEQLKVVLQNPVGKEGKGLVCTFSKEDIAKCNYFIVTVPTPVDIDDKPILKHLLAASTTVGEVLKKEDIIIYESTVFPGATEEICVPILEKKSGLVFNTDFFVGYSPERINPGDKDHTIENILKVTSGSTPETSRKVDKLYASVIRAGTYLAPSIKVAEAAKVIENSQRDINIAFVNELAKIFNLIGLDTQEVLKAAATKWNFLPFSPGLVGGHCIGVDPYYLAEKAREKGYYPEIILAGRKMNDSMGQYIGSEVIKLLIQREIKVKGANILVLGVTFKENCPDVRNTKAVDMIADLKSYGTKITIYDPWASPKEVFHEYQIKTTKILPDGKFDVIVLAVAHTEFLKISLRDLIKGNGILYDIKGVLKERVDARL